MPELSSQPGRLSIPGLERWLRSPQGRYVLDWEQACVDETVADIFGYNALQIGLPQCDFLRTNRIPLRQTAAEQSGAAVCCEFTALPFASNSIDLIVLPHVLEFSDDPHQILREVERVLIPEGQLLILGFNPISLWGMRRLFGRSAEFPWTGHYLSQLRVRDWLQLLGCEVARSNYGCYLPPVDQPQWLKRWHFMEHAGRRWWQISGGVYMLRAVKRTHAMRLITPKWKQPKPGRAKALTPVAHKEHHGS